MPDVEPAWIGLGVCNEFGNRVDWNRRVYLHNTRHAHDACDRRDVADEVEIEPLIQRDIDCIHLSDQKQRIAVRRRTHDSFG